jgi:2-oxoglutarate dehydrogenase E2 component (dihydrolipoamide succinyltransferase)
LLIDTAAAKPEGSAPAPAAQLQKRQSGSSSVAAAPAATYASGTPSPAARKILDEKNIAPASVTGTGKDGRITKDDAVNATPSMELPGGSRGSERTKLSMLRRKVAERLVAARNSHVNYFQRSKHDAYQLDNEYKESQNTQVLV